MQAVAYCIRVATAGEPLLKSGYADSKVRPGDPRRGGLLLQFAVFTGSRR